MEIPYDGYASLREKNGETIKVLLTGDLCPIADVERKILQKNSDDIFGDILPELLDKNISITNLELVLAEKGEPIDKCGPNIKASPNILPAITKAGFDVYSVANNHAKDFGDESFMETLAHIEKSGAGYVGGGGNASTAAKTLKLKVKGHDIAIFSISMHCDCDAGIDTPGVNVLNLPYNAIDIMKATQQGYKVIVVIHDGKEFIPFPAERIRNYCRAFVDAGACAVIGHHPHIIQGVETYNGSVIAYSLGNFLFPRRDGAPPPQPFWFDGYCVRLHIDQSGLAGFDVIPHHFNAETVQLERMKGEKLSGFMDNLNRLNAILATTNENQRYYAADCRSLKYYGESFIRFGQDMRDDSWGTERARYNAKVFHHYLTCNEHWDLLKAVSIDKWHNNINYPEDLNLLIKAIGRLS